MASMLKDNQLGLLFVVNDLAEDDLRDEPQMRAAEIQDKAYELIANSVHTLPVWRQSSMGEPDIFPFELCENDSETVPVEGKLAVSTWFFSHQLITPEQAMALRDFVVSQYEQAAAELGGTVQYVGAKHYTTHQVTNQQDFDFGKADGEHPR